MRRIRVMVFLLAAVACHSVARTAMLPSVPRDRMRQWGANGQSGVIVGTVTDSATGAPIAGAWIRSVLPSARARLPELGEVRTDRRGGYVLSDVRAGYLRIEVRALRYEPRHYDLEVEPGRIDTLYVRMRQAAIQLVARGTRR
jgi:protocatechuate 3,4-dioxygenase beta subunit